MAEDATNKIKSLKQELREATANARSFAFELAQISGKEVLTDADIKRIADLNKGLAESTEQAAKLKDAFNDANEQISVLAAGSPFEKISNNLGDIGGKLASLDFSGANESAQRLVKITQSITFKDAAAGVKDLGGTFLNLGKALLTNPLFLIGAAIAAAVAAVVKLLDKMGVLKKIGEAVGWVFEQIGKFIDGIAESLATAVDAIFGTTLQAEMQAQKLAEQQDKLLEKTKKRSQAVTEASEREIKEQKALGKNTDELERRKLELLIKTAQVEFDLYNQRINNRIYLNGLDEEEIKNLKEKFSESKKALLDAKSDLKVFNNEQKKEADDARKKEAEDNEKAAKEAAERRKRYAADRLAAERQFRDLEIANMEDGTAKEIAQVEEKYKRLIQDTDRNERLLAKEKLALKAELEKQQANELQKITDRGRKEEEKAQAEALKLAIAREEELYNTFEKLAEENYQATLTEQQREIQAVQDKYFELETLAEGNAEALAEIEVAKNRELAAINKTYSEKEKAELKAKVDTYRQTFDELAGIFAAFGSTTGDILSSISAGISETLAIQTQEFAEGNQGKIERVAAYAEAIGSVITGILGAIAEANKQKLEEDLAAIDDKNTREQASLKAKYEQGIISRQEFEKQSADLDKKANAEKDKKGKEAFEKNKKLQIATAVVQGLQGAVSAFAGAMSLGPIAGPIVGAVLAAAVAGLTAANVAKIKSTKYESASSGGGGSSAASVGSASTGGGAAQPSFNLFGQGNNQNTVSAAGPAAQQQTNVNVQSTVSVVEISNKQNQVAVIEERSSL